MISAADALERLREGNRCFVSGEVDHESAVNRQHQSGVATGQHPFAIILACSDSRVPPELIFNQGIGDLFVIRVAGNIVGPSQIGSIEYAVEQFGTRLVVVLGHSNCGAIIATLQELRLKEFCRSPNLRTIVDRIRPALEPILADDNDIDDEAVINKCVRANVRASLEQLQHDPSILEPLIASGDLQVVGAQYSIETGNIEFFED